MNPPLSISPDDRAFLLDLRRDLHRRPELSWQESHTQARLERALGECGVVDV